TAAERWQWLDIGGDGQLDLVKFGGETSGYYERQPDGGWDPFRPFAAVPNVAWDGGDVTLADLTGDGRPDVLVTSDDAVTWYPARGADGFDRSETVPNELDEERGPRLILADASQSIHLADLSGDGLADLVRIRNG